MPKDFRRALNLVSGQRMQVQLTDGKVKFTPEKTVANLRGRLPGLDAQIVRDADRA
jgi:hypothetical protein